MEVNIQVVRVNHFVTVHSHRLTQQIYININTKIHNENNLGEG